MTKRFCDLCDRPAMEDLKLEYHLPFGEGRKSDATDGRTIWTSIKTSVVFQFVNHPTGYGGSPDLCLTCWLKQVENLHAAARAWVAEKGKL